MSNVKSFAFLPAVKLDAADVVTQSNFEFETSSKATWVAVPVASIANDDCSPMINLRPDTSPAAFVKSDADTVTSARANVAFPSAYVVGCALQSVVFVQLVLT